MLGIITYNEKRKYLDIWILNNTHAWVSSCISPKVLMMLVTGQGNKNDYAK